MRFTDKLFWIISISVVFLVFLSLKIALVVYGIYWLVKAIISKYKMDQYKSWKIIQGAVIKSEIEKDCSFRSMMNHRIACVFYPSIKYSYEYNGDKIIGNEISLFKDDLVAYNEKDALEILNKVCSKKTVEVYINEEGNSSLLDISKTLYFNSYIKTHYFIGLSLLFFGIVL